MKIIFITSFLVLLAIMPLWGQETDTIAPSKFSHNVQASLYFIKERFLFSPVYSADKDALHLEARYNYESKHTFSAWAGYNFGGGNDFEYVITPMGGVMVGDTKGVAPGLKIELAYKNFAMSSESEYVFNLEDSANNYLYTWTDFIFTPKEYFWFGLSIQRTRLYETPLFVQHGLFLGGNFKWVNVTGYVFNPEKLYNYFVIAISSNFSKGY